MVQPSHRLPGTKRMRKEGSWSWIGEPRSWLRSGRGGQHR